jgi:hypothetical protein
VFEKVIVDDELDFCERYESKRDSMVKFFIGWKFCVKFLCEKFMKKKMR